MVDRLAAVHPVGPPLHRRRRRRRPLRGHRVPLPLTRPGPPAQRSAARTRTRPRACARVTHARTHAPTHTHIHTHRKLVTDPPPPAGSPLVPRPAPAGSCRPTGPSSSSSAAAVAERPRASDMIARTSVRILSQYSHRIFLRIEPKPRPPPQLPRPARPARRSRSRPGFMPTGRHQGRSRWPGAAPASEAGLGRPEQRRREGTGPGAGSGTGAIIARRARTGRPGGYTAGPDIPRSRHGAVRQAQVRPAIGLICLGDSKKNSRAGGRAGW